MQLEHPGGGCPCFLSSMCVLLYVRDHPADGFSGVLEFCLDGIKRLGFKGGGISAGWAGAKNLTDPEYDVFWSKAQELGAFLFMHPGGVNGNGDPHFGGKGALPNTIGNPLETTIFFSRLIYEGTLDKFPGLKICGAHGGGYLPSYLGRTDAQCRRQDDVCTGKKRPVEDYFHTQLMADIMVFREEGLRHLVAEAVFVRLADRADQKVRAF